jgi:hypothetical protein
VGADLLELADVVVGSLRRRLQRPRGLDALAADVEEPGAERREQPLVQADAVVSISRSRSLYGKCPMAWAPSTIVMMPRARAQRLSSRTGKSCPDWFVM